MKPMCSQLESLSLVLPAFNEASNIDAVLQDARRFLTEYVADFEIIVVNDGSSDLTEELVRVWSKREPRIRLVSSRGNLGYGAALRLGFFAAEKKYILLMDCDRQFSVASLFDAIPLIGTEVLVAGFRKCRADTRWRRLLGFLYGGIIARGVFGISYRDVNCAFKIFPKSLVAGQELHSSGALISVELLMKARARGLRIIQIPVTHFPRVSGQATGGNPWVVLRALKEAMSLRFGFSERAFP